MILSFVVDESECEESFATILEVPFPPPYPGQARVGPCIYHVPSGYASSEKRVRPTQGVVVVAKSTVRCLALSFVQC